MISHPPFIVVSHAVGTELTEGGVAVAFDDKKKAVESYHAECMRVDNRNVELYKNVPFNEHGDCDSVLIRCYVIDVAIQGLCVI